MLIPKLFQMYDCEPIGHAKAFKTNHLFLNKILVDTQLRIQQIDIEN